MREDVLAALGEDPVLKDVDSDFAHLFGSWFNRGFLMLRQVDWSSSARVLDKIIKYEAVHPIENFEDLRRRLAPPDRRLFAFFHPALIDEPLIFVEVALMREVPSTIRSVLDPDRTPILPGEATTAVFYSISSCQKGLAGVSFGNFLIKQVVEDLRRDLPALKNFVTLSPVPGFMNWLRHEAQSETTAVLTAEEKAMLDRGLISGWPKDPKDLPDGEVLLRLVATYLLRAKTHSGRPLDPVARFHLGNGARLERIHAGADVSSKGLDEAAGFMVNYLYDINRIEKNHEAFAERGEVVVSSVVKRLARFEHAGPLAATS
jgi:malonyl-CoA decarboxylase